MQYALKPEQLLMILDSTGACLKEELEDTKGVIRIRI
jgi:hypothetical protein